MRPSIAVILATGLLGACSPQRAVTFQVTGAEAPAAPVRLAFVQVVPLAVSPVPLPVSLETLEEAGTAGSSGLTDRNGTLTLLVPPDRPCDVTVSAPAPGTPVWRGRLDPEGRLSPISSADASSPGLRVESLARGKKATP